MLRRRNQVQNDSASGRRLEGQSAIVTGASRGLGALVAERLARAGANLALTARSEGPLEEVAARARRHGVQVITVPGDISDAAVRAKLVDNAETAFGRIDILVNNAGLFETAPFTSVDPATIDDILAVNMHAVLHLMHAVLPGMAERGHGRVVNMSSLAGRVAPAYSTVYATTKAGEIAASNALNAEYRGTGVTVSAVCPGWVTDTGMWHDAAASRGVTTSRLAGKTTPSKVVRAVMKVIDTGLPEIYVNTPPIRPMLVLGESSPRLRHFMLRFLGVHRAFKRAAELD